MPILPQQRYLRTRHLVAYFGFNRQELRKLVAAGIFTPLYVPPQNGRVIKVRRAWFDREEVLRAEAAGKVVRASLEVPAK